MAAHRRGLRRRALRRTTTSATSGAPTPACSPPCTCSPRWASRRRPLSELAADYSRYAASGEINSTVADAAAAHGRRPDGLRGRGRRRRVDELDGLTVELRRRRVVQPARRNTEPLLRLNVEAPDAARMTELTERVLGMVRA